MVETGALNLDKLLEGDFTFRAEHEREAELSKRFLALFPAQTKGLFIFKCREFAELTREQIRQILARNGLVAGDSETNAESAINEALERSYHTPDEFGNINLYRFTELKDGNGNTKYKLKSQLSDY